MQKVDYFDGIASGNQMVSLYCNELGVSLLSLSNPSQVISFSKYGDCRLHLMHHKMVIYLNKKSNQFIIVNPSSNEYEILRKNILHATLPWYKKNRRIKTAWLIALLFCFILAIYFITVQLIPKIALKVISKDMEIAMGDKIFTSIIANQKIDQKRTRWMNAFANELRLSTRYPIKIVVVVQKEVNAFALPGGYIIIHTGILENMHAAEELAALLGHETAHVNLRHSLKTVLGATASGMLISLVLSDASGIIGTLFENADFLRTMHYSRVLETAADEEGMKLLLRNQINPIAMNHLMNDLKESNKDMPQAITFLSSHPSTDERINNALAFAKKYQQQLYLPKKTLDSIWLQLKF